MLKKVLLLIYISLFFSHKIYSQQLEVRGGVGTSTITKYGAKNRLSFHIGAMYQINLSNNVAIEPGLLFSMEGSGASIVYHKGNINYLEIPVLAKYRVSQGFLNGFSFKLGPYIGYGVYGSADTEGIANKDFFKLYNRVDFGLQPEVAYKLGKVSVYINYKRGMKKVDKYYQEKTRISNLRFGIGYKF